MIRVAFNKWHMRIYYYYFEWQHFNTFLKDWAGKEKRKKKRGKETVKYVK